MNLIPSRPSRLYCKTCDDLYAMPQGGSIKLVGGRAGCAPGRARVCAKQAAAWAEGGGWVGSRVAPGGTFRRNVCFGPQCGLGACHDGQPGGAAVQPGAQGAWPARLRPQYKELACPLDGFQLLLFSLGGADGKTYPLWWVGHGLSSVTAAQPSTSRRA